MVEHKKNFYAWKSALESESCENKVMMSKIGQISIKHEDVETVTDFSYVCNRIYSRGGCEAAVTSRTRLGWVKLRDCQDLIFKKISYENQRKCIQKLCEISNALWKRDMVLRPE